MKTHPLNVSYLVIGLIFLGVAGSWALSQSGIVDFGEVRWLLPMTLVAAGAVGLVAAVAKELRRRDRTEDTDADDRYYDYDSEGDLR